VRRGFVLSLNPLSSINFFISIGRELSNIILDNQPHSQFAGVILFLFLYDFAAAALTLTAFSAGLAAVFHSTLLIALNDSAATCWTNLLRHLFASGHFIPVRLNPILRPESVAVCDFCLTFLMAGLNSQTTLHKSIKKGKHLFVLAVFRLLAALAETLFQNVPVNILEKGSNIIGSF
jgi:hypothetical protein